MKKFSASVAAATIAVLTTVPAAASEIRPYVGFDVVFDKAGQDSGVKDLLKDRYNSVKVNAGVRANEYVGVEVFYQRSGKEKKTTPTEFANVLELTRVQIEAFGLDVKGYLPKIVEKTDFYGTVGVAKYDFYGRIGAANTATGVSAFEEVSERNTGLRFGIGAEYRFDDHWSADVSGRYVKLNSGDDDAFNNLKEVSAGVKYTF